MATFTYSPDYAPVKSRKPNVSTVRFGDGYEQRSAKGINNSAQMWQLVFNQRETTEADAIDAFFEARAGVEAFDWTSPDGDAIRVKCVEWSKTIEKYNRYTVQCTFEEVFEP